MNTVGNGGSRGGSARSFCNGFVGSNAAGESSIPFAFISRSSRLSRALAGYYRDTVAPGSLIEIGGRPQLRHLVSTFAEVLEKFEGRRHTLALGGHLHAREEMVFGDTSFETRFHQTAAVVGPTGNEYGMKLLSGVTLHRVQDGVVDSGEFIRLDTSQAASNH